MTTSAPAVNAESVIERLTRLVAIRSVSREEDAIAADVFAELQSAGLKPQRLGCNVWCELGDAPRPRLLFNSHLDTVPPAAGWTADPWSPTRLADRIEGLGANDAKASVSAMIEAAIALRNQLGAGAKLGGTLVLALTAEEEISGKGLSELIPALRPIDAAIVGEPTALVPMIAQRGLLILRCVAHGRTGHPANTPGDTKDNAIANAAAEILRLREFDFGPAHPLLGRCHAHVTKIEGGVALNVIPDSCEFHVDIRTTPLQPHDELVAKLKEYLHCEVNVRSQRLIPVQTNPDERIVQAVARALPGAAPAGSPAMSDMVFLAGIPSVKIGPGDTHRSHTPDEFITPDELAAGAAAYERIAREYFAAGANHG